ncbi:hypothetical protein HDU92_003223 [Lobulomyces angularis]|nr:hypothetical protein HDU92_003223 [Lobulomyces angularis]
MLDLDEVMFKEKKFSSLEKTVHFLPKHTHQPLEIWQNEMKYVKELIELEPESKWALLTLVNMLREVDQLEEMQKDPLHEKGQKLLETIEILEKLVKIDPSRKIFYMDTKSYILWLVHTISISISNTELNLTSHNLTCIPSPQLSPANPRLSLLTTLNLENNSIGPNLFQNYRMHKLSKEKNSTTAFLFPVLKILNLKKNKLSSLRLLFQTFNFKNKITHFDCSFNVLEQESNLVEEFFYFFEKEQVDFKTLVEFNFQENLSIDWNKLVDKLNKFKFFHCKNLNLIY